VVFFYVGRRTELSQSLLDMILDHPGDKFQTYAAKFLVPRLLQAGWSSPADVKRDGIRRALAFAPNLRDRVLKQLEGAPTKIPALLADLFVVSLADLALSSTFLESEGKEILDGLLSAPTKDNLFMGLPLLWALNRFFTPEELSQTVDRFLDTISATDSLPAEEQSRYLLTLMVIEQRNPEISKAINKRLTRMQHKYPEIFKYLLPKGKTGFRPRPKKK
jgi:hypothetical protein